MDCKICGEKYNKRSRKPMVINCGHSMCSDCVTKIKLGETNCPICKKPITDEKQNYALYELLDMNLIVDYNFELRNSINTELNEINENRKKILLECSNKKTEIDKSMIEFKEAIKNRADQLINQIVRQQELLLNETQNICSKLNESLDAFTQMDYVNTDQIKIEQMQSFEIETFRDKLNEVRKTMELNKQKVNQIDTRFVLIKEEDNQNLIGRISFPLVNNQQNLTPVRPSYSLLQANVVKVIPKRISSSEPLIPLLNKMESSHNNSDKK